MLTLMIKCEVNIQLESAVRYMSWCDERVRGHWRTRSMVVRCGQTFVSGYRGGGSRGIAGSANQNDAH